MMQSPKAISLLVVDDEPTVRLLITDLLADLGYRAIVVADGVAALEVLQSGEHLDLLLTDVGLPGGMNGLQLANAGRLARPDLRVLFITGYAPNAQVRGEFLGPGMDMLAKPFSIDMLGAKVRQLIERSG